VNAELAAILCNFASRTTAAPCFRDLRESIRKSAAIGLDMPVKVRYGIRSSAQYPFLT
jgi:hypothetical protein